jgi:hypothetical protein
MNSANLYSLVGRYDNPILTRFLAPMDCFKIPAPTRQATQPGRIGSLESILGRLKILKIRALFFCEAILDDKKPTTLETLSFS